MFKMTLTLSIAFPEAAWLRNKDDFYSVNFSIFWSDDMGRLGPKPIGSHSIAGAPSHNDKYWIHVVLILIYDGSRMSHSSVL